MQDRTGTFYEGTPQITLKLTPEALFHVSEFSKTILTEH